MSLKKIKIGLLVVFFILSGINPVFIFAQSASDQQTQLQNELKAIEAEIAQYEKQLTKTQSEKNTLNKKINQLKIQQSQIEAQIKKTAVILKQTEKKLDQVEEDIKIKKTRLEELQEQLTRVIELINKKDRYPILAVLIVQRNFADFFKELADYNKLLTQLGGIAKDIQTQSKALEKSQDELSEQREDQQNLLSIKSLQSKQLVQSLTERSSLLEETKAKESNYQAELADRKKRAAEIKNRIYELLGVGSQVTFGQAVTIAQSVSALTGVRASFLLAILTQESNLGKNVGTCNRPGDPPEKGWRVIMKPTRDQEPFLTITSELGKNPDITPVSCPMKDSKGKQVGWGGAMGPAQFIPSTWMGYRGKVAAITGKAANPWDIRDAFIAAAVKLKADGAGSVSGEWTAAMKYFSGGTNLKYRFYGDNVVATTKKYEQDIADLNVK